MRVAPFVNLVARSGRITGYFSVNSLAARMSGDGGTIGTYAAWRFVDRWRIRLVGYFLQWQCRRRVGLVHRLALARLRRIYRHLSLCRLRA
jgi:hypothetical protein